MGSRQIQSTDQLNRLRRQLTVWYAGTFAVILVLLGGGLFLELQRQFSTDLDKSLVAAVSELERSALIREMEAHARGSVIDAVDELRIPDRFLYLLDSSGQPIKPDTAAQWIRNAARKAGKGKPVFSESRTTEEVVYQLYAKPFVLASGARLVAVAAADKVEMEDKYSALIAAFSAAAMFALILLAGGGWLLIRKSTAPIERSIAHMRRFMADAAHELRTPISVVRARAEVALEKPRDAAAYETALRGIAAETLRIGRIVENLLTLSRADAGEGPITRELVYLDDVVVEAANTARFLAMPRKIEIRVDKFEEARILGDAELLRQLVLILLDNAIKFAPEGSRVAVCVGIIDDFAEFEVEDHGPGIPAEHLPHIFDRFFRGDVARTKTDSSPNAIAGEGAGLGLSIAQWITEAHSGNILVRPGSDGGARFIVRFPIVATTNPDV